MPKDCSTCFFKSFDGWRHPCNTCTPGNGFSNYVTDSDEFWKDKEDPKKMDKYEPTDKLAQGLNGISVKELQDTEWPFPLKEDMVESPKHYMLFPGIEVRDVVERLIEKADEADVPQVPPGAMFFADYAQMLQYVMRFMEKNGLEDLKKAQWYLNKMIEAYEPSSAA